MDEDFDHGQGTWIDTLIIVAAPFVLVFAIALIVVGAS